MDTATRANIQGEIDTTGLSARESARLFAHHERLKTDGVTLDISDMLKACAFDPSLLEVTPETLSANVAGTAARLGILPAQFVAAALKRPSLFGQRPETIAGNVTGSAERLAVIRRLASRATLTLWRNKMLQDLNKISRIEALSLTAATFAAALSWALPASAQNADPVRQAVVYAQCMRDNGFASFPVRTPRDASFCVHGSTLDRRQRSAPPTRPATPSHLRAGPPNARIGIAKRN